MKKFTIFLVLMAMFAPLTMKAQQALPYEYGFEASLANAGWSLIDASNSGITSNSTAVQSGSYGFMFNYQDEGAYLMSPILTGGDRGIVLSFYYKVYSSSYVDHFKVGYTTDATVTDPSEFTYGAQVTNGTTSWQEYTATLPAGTVRMAVFYDDGNYDDGYYLFLDDFSFEAYSSCAKPTDLAIDYTEGATRATATWRGEARAYNVMVNGELVSEGQTETSYTIRGIELVNNYTVSVQADCGGEQSGWVSETFFSGCTETFAIPYAYGFENTADINCWTLSPADNMVIDETNNAFAHNGNNFFTMNYTQNPPQYLISPELSGIVNGLHVEFYYSGYSQGVETFQVGYSTTDNDPDSFIFGDEITASSSYQRFSANYPAETKYVAVKHTSEYQYFLFLDDFLFEESASCLEPTNVQYADVTTTGATISWTAGGEETAWDIYVTDDYEDLPDETTTPTYANVDNNTSYAIGNLNPASTNYVYVRAICGEDETSAWSSPATFNTKCEGMALPYTEDFENDLSVCWTIINDNTSYNSIGLNTLPHNGDYALGFNSQTNSGTLIAVLPEVDGTTYPLNNAQVSFWVRHYAQSSYASANPFAVGIMTDPNDASTFVQIGETITPTTTYTQYTVRLNSYTGEGQYIAFKSTPSSTYYSIYTFIDDIEVSVLPSCLEPTDLAVAGGKNAVVTWEGDAASFDVALATSEVEDPADYIVGNTEDNEFDLSSYTSVGMNYVYVRANCGTEGYSEWVSTSFDVNYCTPNPTSHDGSGITGVTFGTGDYVVTNGDGSASLPASAPFYGDYTSMIGAVQAGVESTIAITTSTSSYPYTFVIWVDLDNSLSFEDSEVLYIGKASSGTGTLEATITIPATQTLGDYRMRIYGADSYFTNFYNGGNTNWDADHDPCAAGSWRHAHDYTLRVLEAPSCLAAADVTVDPETISTTSAVISWTNNNGEDATYTVMQGENVLTTTAVNSYTLEGLTGSTTYAAGTYTIMSNCDETLVVNVPAFSTLCDVIVVTDSWTEGFEGGALPACWDQDGDGTWTVGSGDYSTSTGTHTGTYNAMITHSTTGNATKLITPVLDLSSLNNPAITFWYINRSWSGDTDAFAVYYRTASDAEWTLIDETEDAHSTWTEATYMLPNPSATYQIAFEMTDAYGYGVGLDDIVVEEIPSFTLDIEGYGDGDGGYYLIASPVTEVTPSADNGFITEDYDLYAFDQAQDKEWLNYKANSFNLVGGQGYLYASKENTTLTFTGKLNTSGDVTLSKTDDENEVDFQGWNLVGNPFAETAYIADGRSFYVMKGDGSEIIAATSNSIEMMEGIFVVAENDGETMTFTTEAPSEPGEKLVMNVRSNRGNVIDRAIVRFGEGRTLPKFQIRNNSSKLYITMDNADYAVVSSEAMGEMPVSFKAAENGNFTLSVNAENVEFAYLHLIDNMTGSDVDLLSTPSYSFEAKTTDYASRFKLVFANGHADDDFAFFSNGSFVINNEGNATLQMVDVTGRIINSESINGCANVNVNAAPGVYMIRLINGDNVKVQKVVVR